MLCYTCLNKKECCAKKRLAPTRKKWVTVSVNAFLQCAPFRCNLEHNHPFALCCTQLHTVVQTVYNVHSWKQLETQLQILSVNKQELQRKAFLSGPSNTLHIVFSLKVTEPCVAYSKTFSYDFVDSCKVLFLHPSHPSHQEETQLSPEREALSVSFPHQV